ncbi:MAG: pallilysin-related adhesin [Spirochaetaceae bacterium]|jgi:PAS domain-containing protein|nr:pallilysin-related adhesin [Spirochaetaceae bacterium]
MTRGHFKVFTIVVFLLTAGGIGALVFLPKDFFSSREKEVGQTRVVIPQVVGTGGESPRIGRDNDGEGNLRIDLDEGESAVTSLARDFDNDSFEEQIIAYLRLQEIDGPIFITYVEFDPGRGVYRRQWNAPTAATKPGTLMLYSQDLIGDGGICILVSGMNAGGEQTLTVFRKNGDPQAEPFSKIAEFRIEGSITVEEGSRRAGQSLGIATYGRDYESSNMLDQIETTYTYNRVNGLYEQSRVVKIPGSQIEQRRLRELLSGDPGQFENFINGLWYQGEGNRRKFVYFNTAARELIFYNNNSEEIFSWQDSTPTRYGLHINSRNISLTKLRRTVNVELASLESIRLRVYQDIYLRSGPNTTWDGSYQRLQQTETARKIERPNPYLEGTYTGQDGKIVFYQDGTYELTPLPNREELIRRGRYVFFRHENEELLELRPAVQPGTGQNRRPGAVPEPKRETFKVTREEPNSLTLTRVRIGAKGIQDLHESPIPLTRRM